MVWAADWRRLEAVEVGSRDYKLTSDPVRWQLAALD